jgi:hypothetical protein
VATQTRVVPDDVDSGADGAAEALAPAPDADGDVPAHPPTTTMRVTMVVAATNRCEAVSSNKERVYDCRIPQSSP